MNKPISLKESFLKASQIFQDWSLTSLQTRSEILLRFAKIAEEHKDEFAEIISQEVGKPLWESKSEVSSVFNKVSISIDAFRQRCSENIRELPLGRSITRHKPHGVSLVLGPFNFPAHLPNGHIVPALLAGNTLVFKPSELAPKTADFYAKLWKEAGLPDGVLEIVHGGKEVGEALLKEDFKAVFFTGSVPVGLKILDHYKDRPDVIIALEMGGNNPLVVGDISDLHAASYHTIQSAFLSSGQRCTSARRLIVPEGAKGDAFIKELVHMSQSIKYGLWNEKPEPFMGPVVSEQAANSIYEKWQQFTKKGAKVLLEMKRDKERLHLLSPGILDVTSLDIPDEEIFGPLLQVIRVKTFDEAVIEANRTKFGLSAGLLSDSEQEYKSFFEKTRAGVINWNSPTTGASSYAPFGGVGFSGNGRPSALLAADYVSYPVASVENPHLKIPSNLTPGIQGIKK